MFYALYNTITGKYDGRLYTHRKRAAQGWRLRLNADPSYVIHQVQLVQVL